MYSLVANANFTYEEMKLSDLRDRIIKENHLTSLDILKGFHTKSRVTLEYDMPEHEEDKKMLEELYVAIDNYVKDELVEYTQKLYDEKFYELFNKLLEVQPDATIEKLNAGEYDGLGPNKKIKEDGTHLYSASVRDAAGRIQHVLYYDLTMDNAIQKVFSNFIENWLQEHYPNYTSHDKHWDCLPYYFELNDNTAIDYDSFYAEVAIKKSNILGGRSVNITFDSHLKNISNTKSVDYHIFRHIPKDEAEELINKALDDVIYRNNKMETLAYFQNLEAQPITININTKTNRCELIDGYKRLLYTSDPELLSHTTPIRVFTDLDDVGFMSLLYAANIWKYTTTSRDAEFHDRGYLFALKTRYGFDISDEAYKNYSDILKVFRIYDFDNTTYNFSLGEDQLSIMSALVHHKHTMNDINVILNELPTVCHSDLPYDKNFATEIMWFIIRTLGHIRRLPSSDDQKDFTKNTIIKVFHNEQIIKDCTNKHLTSNTYVCNYMSKKHLYEAIIKDMLEDLI